MCPEVSRLRPTVPEPLSRPESQPHQLQSPTSHPALTLVPQPWDPLSAKSSSLPAGTSLLRLLFSTLGQQAPLPGASTGVGMTLSALPHPQHRTPLSPLWSGPGWSLPSHRKHQGTSWEWPSALLLQLCRTLFPVSKQSKINIGPLKPFCRGCRLHQRR